MQNQHEDSHDIMKIKLGSTTGMTRKPPKIYDPQKCCGKSRSCVLESIFCSNEFIYPPEGAILHINWDKTEECYMGRNDLCLCGSGKKQKKCHAGIYEGSILAALWKKFFALEKEIEKQKEEFNVQFLCASDCHECCNEYFYVSAVEYFIIKNHLLTFNPEAFELAKEEGIRQYNLLLEKCPEEYNRLESSSSFLGMFTDSTNLEKFETCPLLNRQTGKCSAYLARPIICRLYGSSYLYNSCEMIQQHLQSNNDEKKVMVGIPYDEHLTENVDLFYGLGRHAVVTRPYPLCYWLANDEKYLKEYETACSLECKIFIELVAKNQF